MAAFRKLASSISSECGNNLDPGEETLDCSSDEEINFNLDEFPAESERKEES